MKKIQTAAFVGLMLMGSPAMAGEGNEAKSERSQASSANAASPFAKAEPIAERGLAAIAGREDVNQVTNSEQTNSVSENSVGDNSVTGELSISDNAFSNTTGFIILNANTGSNVAINASIQVNVALPQTVNTGQ